MIPLNLEDEVILRRTLEELDRAIPVLSESARAIVPLLESATLEEINLKVNEAIGTINLLIEALNNRS